MPAIDPITEAQAYDVVKIDGIENPGCIARGGITGFEREAGWELKKGKGLKGATAVLTSLPPTKGSIKFLLWTPFHFSAWDDIYRARFLYDPTKKKPQAVDIYHPALAKLGIHSVVTTKIGPEVNEGKGLWSITVDLLEYSPPAKKTITTTNSGSGKSGSNGKGNGGSSDPISEANQAKIAELRKQIP